MQYFFGIQVSDISLIKEALRICLAVIYGFQ